MQGILLDYQWPKASKFIPSGLGYIHPTSEAALIIEHSGSDI